MRELDRERTARQMSEYAVDDLRTELAAVAQAEARSRLEAPGRGARAPTAGRIVPGAARTGRWRKTEATPVQEKQGAPGLPGTGMMTTTATMTVKNERADAIRWIQAQMAEYGLTMEELAAAGCFDPPPPLPPRVCYHNAEGRTWDGQGEMPSWLRRAVNAGQSVEFFRVG